MEFIIIGIVILIVVNLVLANEFYEVARMKGYNNIKYFWLAFFFNIFGYLLVVALPNKHSAISNKENVDDLNELPEL